LGIAFGLVRKSLLVVILTGSLHFFFSAGWRARRIFVAGDFDSRCRSGGEEQRFAGVEVEIPTQNLTTSR
jgi:hypothetical protein